jgi:hypothetical protein
MLNDSSELVHIEDHDIVLDFQLEVSAHALMLEPGVESV